METITNRHFILLLNKNPWGRWLLALSQQLNNESGIWILFFHVSILESWLLSSCCLLAVVKCYLSTLVGVGLKVLSLNQLCIITQEAKSSLPVVPLHPIGQNWVICPLIDQSQAKGNKFTLAHINQSALGAKGRILPSQRSRDLCSLPE